MHIIVCIKQVPDPEGPASSFVINHELKRVEPSGIPPLLSIFDENALEAALRIKDTNENVKITVLSAGRRLSNAVLQKALAVGADELVKVEDDIFEPAGLDSFSTASILSSAIKKMGGFDLVMTGRQSADWNAGQAGAGIAEMLNIPAITLARKVEVSGSEVFVERLLPSGYEIVKSQLPSLVMVSSEIGMLRYPTVIQRRDAKKKPVTSWTAADIGFGGSAANRIILSRLYEPEMRRGQCVIIQGATPEETGKSLALRLIEDKVL